MTVPNRATLTADATRRNTVTAAPFADPSAKNDRGEPNGYIRLGNKRAGAPGKPKPGEIAVDIDRKNRILGNPFILRDATDKAARADVIERFRAKYQADLACDGPMAAATQAPAERVKTGQRIVCMCWCWPKPCHGRKSHHRRTQATARIRADNQRGRGRRL
jgi:hypothetical protein